MTLQTALGQYLDLTTAAPGVVDFSRFSMATWAAIVVYKTAYYSFYLPCALGMRLAYAMPHYARNQRICRLAGPGTAGNQQDSLGPGTPPRPSFGSVSMMG